MAKINFSKVSSRLKSAAFMAVGSVASNYVAGALKKTGKIDDKMSAAIRLGIGALLPSFLGNSKKDGMITDFANGMLTEGAVSLAKELKLPGISGTEIEDSINGYVPQPGGVYGTDAGDAINGLSN